MRKNRRDWKEEFSEPGDSVEDSVRQLQQQLTSLLVEGKVPGEKEKVLHSLDEFFSPLRELPPEQKRIALAQSEDLYYTFLQKYRFWGEDMPAAEFYEALERYVSVPTPLPTASPPLVYSECCGEILNEAERKLVMPLLDQAIRALQPPEEQQEQPEQYKVHCLGGVIILQDQQHNFYLAELKPLPDKTMLVQKQREQKMSLGDLAAELKLTPGVLEFYLKDCW